MFSVLIPTYVHSLGDLRFLMPNIVRNLTRRRAQHVQRVRTHLPERMRRNTQIETSKLLTVLPNVPIQQTFITDSTPRQWEHQIMRVLSISQPHLPCPQHGNRIRCETNLPPTRLGLGGVLQHYPPPLGIMRLPLHGNLTGIQVHTIPTQAARLRNAQPSPTHELQQLNLIIANQVRYPLHSRKHIMQLIQRNRVSGTITRLLDSIQLLGWVMGQHIVSDRNGEHAAQHRLARLGNTGPPIFLQPINKRLQHSGTCSLNHTQRPKSLHNMLTSRTIRSHTTVANLMLTIFQKEVTQFTHTHIGLNTVAAIRRFLSALGFKPYVSLRPTCGCVFHRP